MMNTTQLAKDLAKEHDVSAAKTLDIVNGFLAGIGAAVAKGEEVSLPGLGKFKVKDTVARTGRNPRTGEAMEIAAGKKVSFTPAKGLKDRL